MKNTQVEKVKGGFTGLIKIDGKNFLESIDLKTRNYSPVKKIELEVDNTNLIRSLIQRKDKYGDYALSVISKVINYSISLIPEVTKEHNNIDEALRSGV